MPGSAFRRGLPHFAAWHHGWHLSAASKFDYATVISYQELIVSAKSVQCRVQNCCTNGHSAVQAQVVQLRLISQPLPHLNPMLPFRVIPGPSKQAVLLARDRARLNIADLPSGILPSGQMQDV